MKVYKVSVKAEVMVLASSEEEADRIATAAANSGNLMFSLSYPEEANGTLSPGWSEFDYVHSNYRPLLRVHEAFELEYRQSLNPKE